MNTRNLGLAISFSTFALACAPDVSAAGADLASAPFSYDTLTPGLGGGGLAFGVSCTAAASASRAAQIAAADRAAWNSSNGGSDDAWRQEANCELACATAMSERDAACARRPGPEQGPCRNVSHAQQMRCVEACWDDLTWRGEWEQLDSVSAACRRKLGALRDEDTCRGRPPRTWADILYPTVTGSTTHTCFASTPGI